MGRFYSGDIEGKFWVAIQDSDDALFFGGHECEPSQITYHFDAESDWQSIMDGVARCKNELGEYKDKLDTFFATREAYNDNEVASELGVDVTEARRLLTWYARLELGTKISKCVAEQGECDFDAEL